METVLLRPAERAEEVRPRSGDVWVDRGSEVRVRRGDWYGPIADLHPVCTSQTRTDRSRTGTAREQEGT